MNRRTSTVLAGALPVVALTFLAMADHIPGTGIDLTVPYAAEGPGPTFDTLGTYRGENVVDISGADIDETEGNLNMTTVEVRTGMTLAQAVRRWLSEDTLVPIDHFIRPGETLKDVSQRNEALFTSSESAATIAAMSYLQRPVEVRVVGTAEDSASEGVLREGDIIRSVDGTGVTLPIEVQEAVRAKKPGDRIRLDVDREGTNQAFDVTLGSHVDHPDVALLGVLMDVVPADGITVSYNLEDIGGPSAGMMFSLAVVDKLSEGPLNGGRFVAGTGTIDATGEVGPIGGIAHKVRAARDAGAEVFLAPSANCAEAVSRDHGEMSVLKVDTLTEAIDQMSAYDSRPGSAVTCEEYLSN
ncbi:PDZ domain-containing protein [Corynebacterium sp. CCM 9185]|uniref:endopeptidase La n=1 Tax=Corynebacterium marambiense TaxID=2765364 RepID=A0ABS0VY00_9CORY|nr:PDZ domain-containing protein [Corynebacterium marambiense]MBI9001622.1 PDZ domain-containing protein [Corynebacterium marambiense]MCK7662087.1 PDZ domain-containing protein [Corynebacterium marambiense]MCX7541356.1 PDZ domain-containing protein [Corynebacterium marambiense]